MQLRAIWTNRTTKWHQERKSSNWSAIPNNIMEQQELAVEITIQQEALLRITPNNSKVKVFHLRKIRIKIISKAWSIGVCQGNKIRFQQRKMSSSQTPLPAKQEQVIVRRTRRCSTTITSLWKGRKILRRWILKWVAWIRKSQPRGSNSTRLSRDSKFLAC